MNRRCLIHVYAPQNVLPAVCAVRWFGKEIKNQEQAKVTVLLHMPGWEKEQYEKTKLVVSKQCKSQGWLDPIIITESQMNEIVSPDSNLNDPRVLERFRAALGLTAFGGFTEVYYSHDAVGHAAQLCMRAYPEATRITYGESMGLMEDKEYLLASVTGVGWDESKAHLRPKRTDPEAEYAVLIMPTDQTGDCLTGKKLLVVPRELACKVIKELQASMQELAIYSQSLVRIGNSPRYLFLANNLADANFISAELEAKMYEEMIRAHVPLGATVFIKGHPLGALRIDEMVVQNISGDYNGISISQDFNRYPIEIWKDLIEGCEVISLSYSSISIEYLYGKPVHYVFNKEIITKYLKERVFNRFIEGDENFRIQREALKTWDGKSVICSGKRRSFPPTNSTESSDKSASELNEIGIGLFQSGKLEEAIKVFLEGLSKDPLNAGIANNIAAAYFQVGKINESIMYFFTGHQIKPEDRGVILNLFQVLIHAGHKEAARSVVENYSRKNPSDHEIRNLLNSL